MKPKTYLFPGTVQYWRADVPISAKMVWHACRQAAERAGIQKKISPHCLRHYAASRTMPRVGARAAIHIGLSCADAA
jgi:site-specific recombinase XerD